MRPTTLVRRTLRRVLLPAFAVLLPAAGGLQGQSAGAEVPVTATLPGRVWAQTLSDLDFGALAPGSGSTVIPGQAPSDGRVAGLVEFHYVGLILVGGSVPSSLAGPGGASLATTFTCRFSSSPTSAPGANRNCAAPALRLSLGASPATAYLHVGGAISAAATTGARPGLYQGTLVFTFTPLL